MSSLDYAVLFLLCGIVLLSFSTVWQMFVMLTENYTLNRFSGSPQMIWIAISLFFSFSLSVYWFCPNARKKGIIFFITATTGIICYGLGMYYKKQAMSH